MRKFILSVLMIFVMFGNGVAGSLVPEVNVDKGAVPICPIDDCYLTLVDETLCDFIDKFLDRKVLVFSNILNCLGGEDGDFLCLNVLSEKIYSSERQAEYSDPYILQLMTDFHVRLDGCLVTWKKEISLEQTHQSIIYRSSGASVALGLSEYNAVSKKFDRLTLQIHQAEWHK